MPYNIPLAFCALNLLFSMVAIGLFNRWRGPISLHVAESSRFGNARFATKNELADLERKKGLYIGGEIYGYAEQGHLMTVAGTRSGKFTNLIAPNLLVYRSLNNISNNFDFLHLILPAKDDRIFIDIIYSPFISIALFFCETQFCGGYSCNRSVL